MKKSKGMNDLYRIQAIFTLRVRKETVMGKRSKRILEYGNALFLGLGTGIRMFSLLFSLNCRYKLSKLFCMHILFHDLKTHKSNHQKN